MAPSNQAKLRIRHACNQLMVSRHHPRPGKLQHQAENILRQELPQALQALLMRYRPNDDSMVFIQRLDCQLHLDFDLPAETLARRWAMSIVRALLIQLDDRSETNAMLRHANPAAFLAKFLSDLVAGQSVDVWYYRDFSGLKHLPRSAAIRTAILDDVSVGHAACLQMTVDARQAMISACNDEDARRLMQAFTQHSSHDDIAYMDCVRAAIATAPKVSSLSWRESLHWYLRVVSQYPAYQSALLAQVIRALSVLTAGLPATTRQQLPSMRMRDIYRALGAYAAEASPLLGLLMSSDVDELTQDSHGRVLLQWCSQQINHQHHEVIDHFVADTQYSVFGGVLLLLPLMKSLNLHTWLADQPPPRQDVSAVQLFSFLLLSVAQGAERIRSTFSDPALRRLWGLPPDCDMKFALDWWRSLLANQPAMNESFPESLLQQWQTVFASLLDTHSLNNLNEDWRSFYQTAYEYAGLQERLNYFITHEQACLDVEHHADVLLVMLVDYLLHRFAQHLPGFAESSPAYLWQNFLSVRANWQVEHNAVHIHLTRPPLYVILNMTGFGRGQCLLPWLNPLPFKFYLDA